MVYARHSPSRTVHTTIVFTEALLLCNGVSSTGEGSQAQRSERAPSQPAEKLEFKITLSVLLQSLSFWPLPYYIISWQLRLPFRVFTDSLRLQLSRIRGPSAPWPLSGQRPENVDLAEESTRPSQLGRHRGPSCVLLQGGPFTCLPSSEVLVGTNALVQWYWRQSG